jgi:hypothetical protein
VLLVEHRDASAPSATDRSTEAVQELLGPRPAPKAETQSAQRGRPGRRYQEHPADSDGEAEPTGPRRWLVGCAVLGVLVVIGLAGGVGWWFANRPSASTPGAPPDRVAVRLHVAPKPGDLRQVRLKVESGWATTNDPPGSGRTFSTKTVITLEGKIRTVAVNQQGVETHAEITVEKFEVRLPGGAGSSSGPWKVGAVVFAQLSQDNSHYRLHWPSTIFHDLPREAVLAIPKMLLHWSAPADDANTAFCPVEPQSAGATWAVDKTVAANTLLQTWGTKIAAADLAGQGKLVAIVTDNGVHFVDLEYSVTGPADGMMAPGGRLVRGVVTWKTTARVPADGKAGFVKRTFSLEKLGSNDAVPNQVSTGTSTLIVSEEVTYLGNEPISEALLEEFDPPETGAIEPLQDEAKSPLQLSQVVAKQVEGSNRVLLNVSVKVVGPIEPKHWYLCKVKFRTADGVESNPLLVGRVRGAQFKSVTGWVPELTLSRDDFTSCDVYVVAGPDYKSLQRLTTLAKVPLIRQETPVRLDISKVDVIRLKKEPGVQVEIRHAVVAGKPAAAEMYVCWVAVMRDDYHQELPMAVFQGTGADLLELKGTLTAIINAPKMVAVVVWWTAGTQGKSDEPRVSNDVRAPLPK